MKSVGILGGMGPLATVDLFRKIVTLTRADSDGGHIRIFIDCNPQIPDRTKAILEGGPSPVPDMIASARNLERMGADMIVIACNTAHYFLDDIVAAVAVPVLDMPLETARHAASCGYKAVGMLATDGTLATRVYDRAFESFGMTVLKPSVDNQKHVMDIIYKGVKAGRQDYPLDGINAALDELKSEGAEVFVLGCTELPIAFETYGLKGRTLDPTEVIALRAIHEAGKRSVIDA